MAHLKGSIPTLLKGMWKVELFAALLDCGRVHHSG
jgi:hypothetical protein